MSIIKNVRWGLIGEPTGQPCLYFDLDGRPACAFWEQKQGVVERGYVSIDFMDDLDSHLPIVKLTAPNDAEVVLVESNRLIYSPWLNRKLREMLDADTFENGRALGDAPLEA